MFTINELHVGLAALLLAGLLAAATGEPRLEVSGWLQVDESWPFTGDGYFLAWETNQSHQIEVRHPKKTSKDLLLRLNFFSKWKRAPSVTLFPCDGAPVSIAAQNGTWLSHVHRIVAADCQGEIEVKYNIHLRDEGDLFAWKLLEITSAEPAPPSPPLKRTKPTTEQPLRSRGLLSLFDRQLANDDDDGDSLEVDDDVALSCTTTGCDKSSFRSAGFITLENGLPDRSQVDLDENNLFVNGKGANLTYEISAETDLSNVNVCLGFRVYSRNADNSLNLYVGNKNDPNSGHQLLTRVQSNSLALGRRTDYEDMTFCSETIKPRLFAKDSLVTQATLLVELLPSDARLFIQMSKTNGLELRPLHKIQSHLPDLSQFVQPYATKTVLDVNLLDEYWDLGQLKDKLHSDFAGPYETPMIFMNGTKVDDPNADLSTLSLTSRWLQLDNLLPVNETQFAYKLYRRNYLQQVELQYQIGEHPADAPNWYTSSQIIYDLAGQDKTKDTDFIELLVPLSLAPSDVSPSGVFRLRLVHKFNVKLEHGVHLNLLNLAYADLCLEFGYSTARCEHEGTCKSLGNANGICYCRPGWTGPLCQVWNPCENLYGPTGVRGDALCNQVGAKCVSYLPEIRCQWNEDKFFKQNFVFNEDGSYTIIDDNSGTATTTTEKPDPKPPAPPSSSGGSTTVLVIIFGAMSFLLIVIIVNMVKRLRKTNSRLEAAENEAFELKRRSQRGPPANGQAKRVSPRGSQSAGPSQSGASVLLTETEQPPVSVVSFQNRPFDASKSKL